MVRLFIVQKLVFDKVGVLGYLCTWYRRRTGKMAQWVEVLAAKHTHTHANTHRHTYMH